MSTFDHDKLLRLEETLDWDAIRVLPALLGDADTRSALEEIELFREALEAESSPRPGFTEEVVGALRLRERRSGFGKLVLLNGLAAAAVCFLGILHQTGFDPATPLAPALLISLAFGAVWAGSSRRRILQGPAGLEAY